MAQLLSSSISAPGFLGVNTQESPVTLESGYASIANNCVIDKSGRLASRKGWTTVTTDNGTLADTDAIKAIFEFKNTDGNITYISAGGNKLFTGTATLVEKKLRNAANSADISIVSTNDNWQISSLPDGSGATAKAEAFLAQIGNPILYYHDVSGTFIFQRLGDIGAVPTGYTVTSFDPNCSLTSFGRHWCANTSTEKLTVYYSQLLDGITFTGTGSGLLDVSAIVGNNDEIVALASHNNYLVVFCKNNIVVYANPDDVNNLQLIDVVKGVGCIARDSVQNIGTDLVFLSKSGVRSLARTLQENTMPMRELSLNIRDDVVGYISSETAANIKSVYYEKEAMYLLTFPSSSVVLCFDTRNLLPNGAAKVTIWLTNDYYCFCPTESQLLYIGLAGKIGYYHGYTDGGSSYRMSYYTSSADLGEPTTLKILKKVSLISTTGNSQEFIFKYGFDYRTTFTTRITSSPNIGTPAEYGVSEYTSTAEYTTGVNISNIAAQLGGTGKVIQFGVESIVNGTAINIQKLEIYLKSGRTI